MSELLRHHFGFLERLDQGYWIRWPVGGIGLAWVGGVTAQVDGTHALNLIALGILGVGSSCLGLWRLYEIQATKISEERKLSQIRVDEARRASLARVPEVLIVSPAVMPPAAPEATP